MTYQTLIEKLEKATGPDVDLDHAIAALVKPSDGHGVLGYTSSVDAALTLVPEGCAWQVGCEIDFTPVARVWGHDISADDYAATPIIALCIVALKAREAENG